MQSNDVQSKLAPNLTFMACGQIGKYDISSEPIALEDVINSFANASMKRNGIILSRHMLFTLNSYLKYPPNIGMYG